MHNTIPPNMKLGSARLLNRYVESDPTDPLATQFYASIGRAICAWQTVEAALGELFLKGMPCRFEILPGQMFYNQKSFDNQLAMLDVAMLNLPLDSERIMEWKSIHKKCKDLYKKRNIVAHSSVMTECSGDPPKVKIRLQKNQFQLATELRKLNLSTDNGTIKPRDESLSKQTKFNNALNENFESEDLQKFAVEFLALGGRIRSFEQAIQ